MTFLTNVTENLTELARGEVYFGSQFRGREDMEIEGASSMVGGAYALLIYILSDKNRAAESERRVGFSFQRLTLVTHLHSTCLLPQSFHNLPKQASESAGNISCSNCDAHRHEYKMVLFRFNCSVCFSRFSQLSGTCVVYHHHYTQECQECTWVHDDVSPLRWSQTRPEERSV